MADQYAPRTANEELLQNAAFKKKLVWRMVFAGLMILTLLATLMLFDRLSAPEEPIAPPQFTEPVPVAKKEVTQALKPAEPPPDENKEVEPEGSAAPVDKAAPPAEPLPPPAVPAQPVLPKNQATPSTPTSLRTAPSAAAQAKTSEPAPTPKAEPAPPVASAPPRLFPGFALQAGVFSDVRRAEELHAKLTLNGIPSTLEARVQAGPFKSRQEAEAAREKMKALGIDAVMLPPKGAAGTARH